jgi:hypothetical protein
MTKKSFLFIFIFIVIIFIVFFLIKYRLGVPKRIIKKEIVMTRKAIENENTPATLRFLSENFTYKNYNRENIEPQIISFFKEFDRISLKINNLEISIENDRARVNFNLLLMVTASGMTGPIVGDILNPATIFCIFTKNHEWLLDSIAIYEDKK